MPRRRRIAAPSTCAASPRPAPAPLHPLREQPVGHCIAAPADEAPPHRRAAPSTGSPPRRASRGLRCALSAPSAFGDRAPPPPPAAAAAARVGWGCGGLCLGFLPSPEPPSRESDPGVSQVQRY
jgi:hypothetical protein